MQELLNYLSALLSYFSNYISKISDISAKIESKNCVTITPNASLIIKKKVKTG